jgi:hypothetical protein
MIIPLKKINTGVFKPNLHLTNLDLKSTNHVWKYISAFVQMHKIYSKKNVHFQELHDQAMTHHLLKALRAKSTALRGLKDPYEHFLDCLNALLCNVIQKVKECLKYACVPTMAEGKYAKLRPFLDYIRLAMS